MKFLQRLKESNTDCISISLGFNQCHHLSLVFVCLFFSKRARRFWDVEACVDSSIDLLWCHSHHSSGDQLCIPKEGLPQGTFLPSTRKGDHGQKMRRPGQNRHDDAQLGNDDIWFVGIYLPVGTKATRDIRTDSSYKIMLRTRVIYCNFTAHNVPKRCVNRFQIWNGQA